MTKEALWSALAAELDRWDAASIRLWLRDDDTIAPSPALERLAGLSEGFALPVLLAVIPMLAEPTLTRALQAMPTLLPCQHGCWHRNHAATGSKKSEFGTEREPDIVLADIAEARLRLSERLGAAPLPVFVPPWNRIDRALAAELPRLGFTGLSCFHGFVLDPESGPILVNTDIDVMDWHGGRIGRPVEALLEEIAARLAAQRLADSRTCTLGLLLHHRDHDETAWQALNVLLQRLCAHPAILRTDPRQLFAPACGMRTDP